MYSGVIPTSEGGDIIIIKYGITSERLSAEERREARLLNRIGLANDQLDSPWAFLPVSLVRWPTEDEDYDV